MNVLRVATCLNVLPSCIPPEGGNTLNTFVYVEKDLSNVLTMNKGNAIEAALSLLQYRSGPCELCGNDRQLKYHNGRWICIRCYLPKEDTQNE